MGTRRKQAAPVSGRRKSRAGAAARAPAPPRAGRFADVRDAALTLFAKLGYHGTSMKDIAGALRMRAPSLYNHVAAKQELLRDIVVSTHQIADRELRAAIESSDDVAAQLRRAAEVHVRFHTRHPREWRVASRELEHLDEPARSEVRRMRHEFEELIINIIERGVAEGRFSVASPKLTAYAIFRMTAGVGQWYRPGGEFSDSEIAFCFGDLALRMVGIEDAARGAPSTRTGRTRRRRAARSSQLRRAANGAARTRAGSGSKPE